MAAVETRLVLLVVALTVQQFAGTAAVLTFLRHRLANEEGNFVYDYSKHGQDWVQGTCASRQRQSPIDIPAVPNALPTAEFKYSYLSIRSPFDLVNNGHTLSADLRGMGYGGVNYGDAWYDLLYLNVHAFSEHTFAGVHTPLELHLVHKRYDSAALLVVAIPMNAATPPPQGGVAAPAAGSPYMPPPATDPNANEILQALLRVPPPPPMMKARVPGDNVDAPDVGNLIGSAEFFGYPGSTTAPPCAEDVVWLVRKEPVMVSDTQARYLHDAIFFATQGNGNFRATMPLEGRDLILYRAIRSVAPTVPDAPAIVSSAAAADPEFMAKKWARDAVRIAAASLDYVRNLDYRLHVASQASSTALAPVPVVTPEALAPAPAPAPAPATTDAQQAAIGMAGIIAEAAKEAVKSATTEIAKQANEAAVAAAASATDAVLERLKVRDQELTAAREAAMAGYSSG